MPELKRVKQLEKDISIIESKKSRLTDLLIDGKIEQEDYDERLEIPGMLCIVEPVMPIRLRY